ncbi:hypothetical protein G7046_g2733 [Stylonectria norvegica]|nr:hypothetical protein G7046_g2733 [Stylonectria norvegica]
MKSATSLLAPLFAAATTAAALPRLLSMPNTVCGTPGEANYTILHDPFTGDEDTGQPGIILQTKYNDGESHWFMVYQNSIAPKTSVFIDIPKSCMTFQGRVVRGNKANFKGKENNLGTWAEINWVEFPRANGDISVIEGNDGPVLFDPDDEGSPTVGFSHDIVPDAPEECKTTKEGGATALKPTDKNGYDKATREYTNSKLDGKKVYIEQTDAPVVSSKTGRVKLTFYQGYH